MGWELLPQDAEAKSEPFRGLDKEWADFQPKTLSNPFLPSVHQFIRINHGKTKKENTKKDEPTILSTLKYRKSFWRSPKVLPFDSTSIRSIRWIPPKKIDRLPVVRVVPYRPDLCRRHLGDAPKQQRLRDRWTDGPMDRWTDGGRWTAVVMFFWGRVLLTKTKNTLIIPTSLLQDLGRQVVDLTPCCLLAFDPVLPVTTQSLGAGSGCSPGFASSCLFTYYASIWKQWGNFQNINMLLPLW